ncbi:hypothetical protein I2I05_18970 [Hymenobacter sp. BT683]|uniref:Uncharacterized protein n=1 Tax=Hymenobacter jeongseonensis TaxID=2791027 RepID=A0ABS0INN0_9BACT|nr:hypothetical protein [Hymenobacter jeongseonensis]MBF9239483.1 hypothetical protein [Hymenobacter jeongseonensis]
MKIPAFHSQWRGLALEDAWHDNDECFIVKSIPRAHRIPGKETVTRKHCRYCVLLNEPATSKPLPRLLSAESDY